MKIILRPIGEVDHNIINELLKALVIIFGCKLEIGKKTDVPMSFFNKQRNQYEGSKILSTLKKNGYSKGEKILGIADIDLYTDDLNFIFGLADANSGLSLISLKRLKQEYYGNKPDEMLFKDRAVKEAVHELGHTFGLGHCSDNKCIMHFSNSLQDTDIKQTGFCSRCHPKLIK